MIDNAGAEEVESNSQHFDKQLKRRTTRSIIWTITEAAAEQIFSFVVFVLMARVLPKAELGTFAITFVFMDMGRIISTAGVTQRIARAKSFTARQLDTIFWTNVLLGALYCTAMVIFAHLVEASFHAPELEAVFRWMTIALMLSSVGSTHMALRLREFGHSTLAVRSFLAGLLGAVVAIAGIAMGFGIWAFVFQRIVREAVASTLAWKSYNWRPRFVFDVGEAKSDLKIGKELVGAQLVSYLTLRSQDLLIGKFMGPVPLSSYRVAWRSAELIGPQIVSTFSTVALQTFSRLQDHRAELRSAYTTLLRQCALLSIPALVGYGIAGPWLVPALFGAQWRESGWIALALMPLAIPFTLNYFVLSLLSALGHVTWQRHLALLELISTVLITTVAVWHGLIWVAIGYSVRAYLMLPLQMYFARKVSGIGIRDHLWAISAPLAASAVMVTLIGPVFYVLNPSTFLVIGPVCLLGALLYGLAVLALLPKDRRRLFAIVSNRQRSHL